ncbi:MAG: GreA/GreB family elongation factor [Alphaproteobacteria bacterium]|nr:GreA/GreB family elongation factor [Alphaproteobacteria bacterium]
MSDRRYLTREGYQAIATEIDHLWHTERPDVVEQVTAAAELGDRSENAEYIYGKKRLRQIDSRLRYLRKKIDGVTVVDLADMPARADIVFGARVTVDVYEPGEEDPVERTWRLVDKDESDPKVGRISVQSPIGQALMGKREGDFFKVVLPRGPVEMEVTEVYYGADDGPG